MVSSVEQAATQDIALNALIYCVVGNSIVQQTKQENKDHQNEKNEHHNAISVMPENPEEIFFSKKNIKY